MLMQKGKRNVPSVGLSGETYKGDGVLRADSISMKIAWKEIELKRTPIINKKGKILTSHSSCKMFASMYVCSKILLLLLCVTSCQETSHTIVYKSEANAKQSSVEHEDSTLIERALQA